MIKVTITKFTSPSKITLENVIVENVTVVDVDECYIRLITSEGELIKLALDMVKGYTAEVI